MHTSPHKFCNSSHDVLPVDVEVEEVLQDLCVGGVNGVVWTVVRGRRGFVVGGCNYPHSVCP